MFDKLKNLFILPKKEVHDVGLAFVDPVLESIKNNIKILNKSFNDLQNLIDSDKKISFDKIPAASLHKLIEKTKELSAMIEASDAGNKVKLTELLAKMHDAAVQCSSMSVLLKNSSDNYQVFVDLTCSFESLRVFFSDVCQLL